MKKESREKSEKRREEKRRKKITEEKESEERRCRRKGRKVAWGPGESKSRLAKAAGAEPAGQMRDDKCTPLWREAHLEVKMPKAPQHRSTLEVEMLKKCTPLWREAHFEVKMCKAHQRRKLR